MADAEFSWGPIGDHQNSPKIQEIKDCGGGARQDFFLHMHVLSFYMKIVFVRIIRLFIIQDKQREKIFKLEEMCCQGQLGSCTVCGYPTHSLHRFSCEYIFLLLLFMDKLFHYFQ